MRGGSWDFHPLWLRAAFRSVWLRDWRDGFRGFRFSLSSMAGPAWMGRPIMDQTAHPAGGVNPPANRKAPGVWVGVGRMAPRKLPGPPPF